MDDFTAHILRSLVEGHEARAGMKERSRALTEYEIARRAGFTDFSYVQFSTTREYEQVRDALDDLEREGWVTQWQRVGRYAAYVPTELGTRRAKSLGLTRALEPEELVADPADGLPAPSPREGNGAVLAPELALNRLVQQLDEVLALLRAIDARLRRDD
jgi:hypothetical protein